MCFRASTVHHPSSKTQVHRAVRHTYDAHFPLLNYICTSTHTCKHTGDSCLLSRMLNCPPARNTGSQVLKQTVACVKEIQTHIQVHSGDGPESLTRPHHSHFSRSIWASSCPRTTKIHLLAVWCEKSHLPAEVLDEIQWIYICTEVQESTNMTRDTFVDLFPKH